jgi:hypothetical protein
LEGPEEKAWFGSALDMTPDGTKLVVGSDGKDANGQDSGWVAVYSLNNGTWKTYGDAFVGGEFDRLGIRGVPISGTSLEKLFTPHVCTLLLARSTKFRISWF